VVDTELLALLTGWKRALWPLYVAAVHVLKWSSIDMAKTGCPTAGLHPGMLHWNSHAMKQDKALRSWQKSPLIL